MAVGCGLKHEQRQSDNSSKWKTVPHMYTPGKKRMHVGINRSGLRLHVALWDSLVKSHVSYLPFFPGNINSRNEGGNKVLMEGFKLINKTFK